MAHTQSIVIDATDAYDINRRGIGVQMQSWLEAADFSTFPNINWIIARQHREKSASVKLHGSNVQAVEGPKYATSVDEYVDYLHSLNPDVIFTPLADATHFRQGMIKQVSIDYGMEDFYWRDYVPARQVDAILAAHEFALQNFDGIITVSKTSQKDLSWFYPEYKHKIQVVYPSAQTPVEPTGSLPEALVGESYFVLVGYELKKNIMRISSAFDQFKRQTGSKTKLAIIGKPGYRAEQIDAHISQLDCSNDITRLGYVSDSQKQVIFEGSHAVLALSLYEGFGISALEGLLADKPVLVSDNGSLKEVVGRAGYLADPFSIPSMVKQLTHIDKLTENPKQQLYAQRIANFDASTQAHTLLHYLSSFVAQ